MRAGASGLEPCELERQPHIGRHRRPRHQGRLLEHETDRCAPAAHRRPRRGHAIRPCDGALKPAMMRNAVDLPQPEGPSSDTNSPGARRGRGGRARPRRWRRSCRRRRARRRGRRTVSGKRREELTRSDMGLGGGRRATLRERTRRGARQVDDGAWRAVDGRGFCASGSFEAPFYLGNQQAAPAS